MTLLHVVLLCFAIQSLHCIVMAASRLLGTAVACVFLVISLECCPEFINHVLTINTTQQLGNFYQQHGRMPPSDDRFEEPSNVDS